MKEFKATLLFVLMLNSIVFSACKTAEVADQPEESKDNLSELQTETDIAEEDIKKTVSFPDWLGETDNSLAMNSLYNFKSWKGQGKIHLNVSDKVKSFKLYVNNHQIPAEKLKGECTVDVSEYTENGESTLQISEIKPSSLKNAVEVQFDFPSVIDATSEDKESERQNQKKSGINPLAFDYIEKIIKSDVKNGFSSAQLAVIKNGQLVYSNAFGKINSYNPDGSVKPDSADVTEETLYDLASVTKVMAGNYAVQYLVSRNLLNVNDRVCDILGSGFYKKTVSMKYRNGVNASLKQQKLWKSEITVKDLMCHRAGFPSGPVYQSDKSNKNDKNSEKKTPEKERSFTLDSICRMPLFYEPETKILYSDVDYMLICFIVEKISGQRLDDFLREKIYGPMNLHHVTFNPLLNGFSQNDCAATELITKKRPYTIHGEVHDDNAFFHMNGVSGHAGLFSNAEDLAKLASVMLTGGYESNAFFTDNVMDFFTSPEDYENTGWGLGWYRESENSRPWYFGSQAPAQAFGHQGWTGTFVMADPVNGLVIAYLTNKVNTPGCVHNGRESYFEGSFYTSGQIGFVPSFIYKGMKECSDKEYKAAADSLLKEMLTDKQRLIQKEKKVTKLKKDSGIYKSEKALKEVIAE